MWPAGTFIPGGKEVPQGSDSFGRDFKSTADSLCSRIGYKERKQEQFEDSDLGSWKARVAIY